MACPKSVKPGTKHKKGPFHRIGAGFVKIPPQLLTKSLILTCFALHLQDAYLLIQLLNGCYSAACVPPLS